MDRAGLRLSVVIPAHNEAGCIADTLTALTSTLDREAIDYELLVVDDASSDGTYEIVAGMAEQNARVRPLRSPYDRGFGLTVRAGLDHFAGDAVAIYMADRSDDPEDLVMYHRLLEKGYDCVFGSRFMRGAEIYDYPRLKLLINRFANWCIRALFRHGYNDTTNAFKAYRREVIETVQPLLSHHFNLTVELPLKAIVRGHNWVVAPISWRNRATGVSKLSMQEMGSRYLFIVLYIFLEMTLSRGDYRRPGALAEPLRRRGTRVTGDGAPPAPPREYAER
jgi:dolichol-phosphate mannosyltransferase